MEKKIDEIFKFINNSDKLNEFDKIFEDMQKVTFSSKELIDKLKYDDLIVEKVERISNER